MAASLQMLFSSWNSSHRCFYTGEGVGRVHCILRIDLSNYEDIRDSFKVTRSTTEFHLARCRPLYCAVLCCAELYVNSCCTSYEGVWSHNAGGDLHTCPSLPPSPPPFFTYRRVYPGRVCSRREPNRRDQREYEEKGAAG